jgi:hypothetical protein
MRLTDEQLSDFKKLYKERFGTELTDEEANEKGLKAVRLMELIYKPMTHKEYERVTERQEQLLPTISK